MKPEELPRVDSRFTARELETLRLVATGCSNREIGTRLGVMEGTVKNWIKTLMDKTGQDTRVELAVWFIHKTEIEPLQELVRQWERKTNVASVADCRRL